MVIVQARVQYGRERLTDVSFDSISMACRDENRDEKLRWLVQI